MERHTIQQKKSRLEGFMILGISLLVISFILTLVHPVFMIGFIFGMILMVYVTKSFKTLSIAFKQTDIQSEIQKIIPDAIYQPTEGLSKEFIYSSGILKKEDRFNSEDYLEGTIRGKRFRSSDVHLQDVRSNGKTTTVVTVFQGRFFEIDFNKKFENEVYIFPNLVGRFGYHKGLTRVDVESIVFNKRFDVFSKDQTSAFYLLKPRFIERLLEFRERYPRVRYGFKDHVVYIAIDTRKDAFDLKMFKPMDAAFFREISDEMKLIEDLIDLIG